MSVFYIIIFGIFFGLSFVTAIKDTMNYLTVKEDLREAEQLGKNYYRSLLIMTLFAMLLCTAILNHGVTK